MLATKLDYAEGMAAVPNLKESSMVDIVKVLFRIVKLEERVSEVYAWLSRVFNDQKDVSLFFEDLSDEEKQHREIARYQLRLVLKNSNHFSRVKCDIGGIDLFLGRLEDFLSSPPPALKDAIGFALEIENNICEVIYKSVAKDSNRDVADLIDHFVAESYEHRSKCAAMARVYGAEVPVSQER